MLLPPETELLELALAPDNLNKAWNRLSSNDGAPGIDGLTIENFVAHFRDCGKAQIETIRQGQYQPYPVKRVYIEKEDGSLRGLGILTVFDRVIQQAIMQTMTPIFDPEFSESSFGYRPNRSQHQAIKQVQNYVKEGRRIAADVDLSKFFDRVNHDPTWNEDKGQRIAESDFKVSASRRRGKRCFAGKQRGRTSRPTIPTAIQCRSGPYGQGIGKART